jgi:hypothetical protein
LKRVSVLRETLELAVGLAGRFADMRSVTLNFQPAEDFPTVMTSPFHLLNLIWRVLDFAMDAAGAGKTVGLAFDGDARSVNIRFTGMEASANAQDAPFPTENAAELLHMLGAAIRQDGKRERSSLFYRKMLVNM